MKNLVLQLGFWSAILVTMFNVSSTFSRIASFPLLSMVLGLLVASIFIVMMVSVHFYAPDDRKILTLLGVAFAVVCATLLSINYYLQITVARWTTLPLLSISNPHSIMWAVEVLGYGFMGLATLFPAIIFSTNRLEVAIRWLFIGNGILGVGGIIGFVVVDNPLILLPGLIVWDVVFPLMTLLLAIFFKLKMGEIRVVEATEQGTQ